MKKPKNEWEASKMHGSGQHKFGGGISGAGQKGWSTPSKGAIETAGHEMKVNPPAILAHTAKKFGKARSKKQKIAIMLSKARKGE